MLGYLLSTAVYTLVLVACLTIWRKRLGGSALASAAYAQLGWSAISAIEASRSAVPFGLVIAAEYLRDLAWALVLTRYLRGNIDVRAARVVHFIVVALLVLVSAWAVSETLQVEPREVSSFIERHWLVGGMTLAITGLILVEQVARNTRSAHRWNLKYIWLAVGGFYACDLCLYSIGMLHAKADEFWVARGFVNALLGVLLAVGLRRITAWEAAAFLSPRVVFFNATLLAASLYIFVLAAGSYFVRELGGTWGRAGQLLFLAAGAVLFVVAALSEQFRAWSRVTVAKHFFPYRYDYRREWQKLTRALSESADSPLYDRIVSVMTGFVNAASGALWLKDSEGEYVPAGGDLAPPGTSHETGHGAFFDYLLEKEWVFDLDEARHPRPNTIKLDVPAWMLSNPRMWLVVPLICESALIGFVIIGQPLVTARLSWEELDLLKAAGRQVASFLAFEQAAKRIAEAHQFEAMNRLSAVLMHDLRHLIAQQALVVQNAARHRGNPEFFDDAILTIDNSVKRMTRLMEELRSGLFTEELHRVEVADMCAEAVRRCTSREPHPTLDVSERGIEVMLSRERMLHALEHLIRNAQDATPAQGAVAVRARTAGNRAVIEVADTGSGMDAEFIRHRLFRPFDTTKSEGGFGIGAYEAREFVRKCGGSIEVDSAPGRGTRFVIHLPLAPALETAEAGTEA